MMHPVAALHSIPFRLPFLVYNEIKCHFNSDIRYVLVVIPKKIYTPPSGLHAVRPSWETCRKAPTASIRATYRFFALLLSYPIFSSLFFFLLFLIPDLPDRFIGCYWATGASALISLNIVSKLVSHRFPVWIFCNCEPYQTTQCSDGSTLWHPGHLAYFIRSPKGGKEGG